jgi:hypothetical protein
LTKKAVTIIELVTESLEKSSSQIEKEILADAQIPWCAKIAKVEVYGT